MNSRFAAFLLMEATLVFAVLSCTAFTEEASRSAYTIPAELKPVWTWKNGYSAEETRKYRQEYNDNTLTGGEDDGAYAITHL